MIYTAAWAELAQAIEDSIDTIQRAVDRCKRQDTGLINGGRLEMIEATLVEWRRMLPAIENNSR